MELGILLRNSGPVATPEFIAECARAGDASELDHLWVLDHIAIPPDDAEGSGGRYVDALATLAYVAGITTRIRLGTSVLVVPYRPALATANWVAAIQELSGGRLLLGVGAGWMAAEFAAAEVPREQRGKITNDTLAFMDKCFASDVINHNGQDFIFSPRPAKPAILVGGQGEKALQRVINHGDGWMPTVGDVDKLREPVAMLQREFAAAGKAAPQIIPLATLDLDDPGAAAAHLQALDAIGVTGLEHPARYTSVEEFQAVTEKLLAVRARAGLS